MAKWLLCLALVACYPFSSQLAGNVFTYAFAHAGLVHLALNAITTVDFAHDNEQRIGMARTLALFAVASIIGGAIQLLLTPGVALMGASAGAFGLIAASVRERPQVRIGIPLLMFRGDRVLAFLVVLSAALLLTGLLPQVAHAAHLGGVLVGLLWTRKRVDRVP